MISRESIIIVSILLIAGYFLSLNSSPTAKIIENNLETTESTSIVTTIPQNTITTVAENQEEVQSENKNTVTSTIMPKKTPTTQQSTPSPLTTIQTSTIETTTIETTSTIETTTTVSIEKIIFSEVYYDTAGDDNNEEYVVIYNPNNQEVNLDGFSITDNSGSWSFPNTIINAQDYLIIARDSIGFENLFGCQNDIGGFTRGLNNDGDQLSLQKNQQMDFVAWEKGAADAYPDWDIKTGKGKSLKKTGNGNSPSDWSEADSNPCSY